MPNTVNPSPERNYVAESELWRIWENWRAELERQRPGSRAAQAYQSCMAELMKIIQSRPQ